MFAVCLPNLLQKSKSLRINNLFILSESVHQPFVLPKPITIVLGKGFMAKEYNPPYLLTSKINTMLTQLMFPPTPLLRNPVFRKYVGRLVLIKGIDMIKFGRSTSQYTVTGRYFRRSKIVDQITPFNCIKRAFKFWVVL